MRILVTGAAGFVGSHLAKHLVAAGHSVVAVWHRSDRRLTGIVGIERVQADLRTPHSLPARIDAVVHAAVSYGSDEASAADIAATQALLAYAGGAGATAFIYLSSVDVYGTVSVPQVDEASVPNNPNAYGRAKLHNEELVAAAPMATIALRLPGIVGPDHNRPWIARLAAEMAETGRASVYNPDSPFNNSLHVDDLCRFVARLLDTGWKGHRLVTLAAAQPIAIRTIVERLMALRYSNAQLHVVDGRRHPYTIAIDNAVRDFGFAPMSMDEQLIRFAKEL